MAMAQQLPRGHENKWNEARRRRRGRGGILSRRKLRYVKASDICACRATSEDSGGSASTSTTTTAQGGDGMRDGTTCAEAVVRQMYAHINAGEVDAATALLSEDVIYEDLNFPETFQGKRAVSELFAESVNSCPKGVVFIIDDCVGDKNGVGLTWHVELDGKFFPNTRGASLYRINEDGQLCYARDVVESPTKLGSAAFGIMKVVTPILRQVLKDEGDNGPKNAAAAAAAAATTTMTTADAAPASMTLEGGIYYAMAVSYCYILLLSPNGQLVPGDAAWQIQPEQINEVIKCSTDFFFILSGLERLGIQTPGLHDMFISGQALHPMTQGLFNFAEAYIFMFLPVLLSDLSLRRRVASQDVTRRWAASMFLTNVFFIPMMAARANAAASVDAEDTDDADISKTFRRVFGVIGLCVGIFSLAYAFFGGGADYGSVSDRLHFYSDQLASNRIALAFTVDVILFAYFQSRLLGREPHQWWENFPFFGLAFSLIL